MKGPGLLVRLAGLGLLPAPARRPRLVALACRRALACRAPRGGPKAGPSRQACARRGLARGEVNVVFLGASRMRALNRRFLGRDRDTDVLAFAYDAQVPGARPADLAFGDVFVSAAKARSQAADLGHGALEEVLTLVAHGSLHLLGWDDASRAGRAAMDRLQGRVVRPLLPRPRKRP